MKKKEEIKVVQLPQEIISFNKEKYFCFRYCYRLKYRNEHKFKIDMEL